MNAILGFSIFLIGTGVFAEGDKTFPGFNSLGSETHKMSVSMECSAKHPNKPPYDNVTCRFTRLELTHETKEEYEKKSKDNRNLIMSAKISEIKKDVNTMCDAVKNKPPKYSDPNVLKLTEVFIEKTCNCRKESNELALKECFLAGTQEFVAKSKSCNITGISWLVNMRKSGPREWTGTDTALCAINTHIIRYEKSNPDKWVYEAKRARNPDGGPSCKNFLKDIEVETYYIFSSDVETSFMADCPVISIKTM